MSTDFFAILMFVAFFEVSLYYEGDIKASQQVSQNLFAKIKLCFKMSCCFLFFYGLKNQNSTVQNN